MKRILKLDERGYPNFLRAAKIASLGTAFTHTGQSTVYPFKRRARRNEGTMYLLAYLLSVDEKFEEVLKKAEGMKITFKDKIDKDRDVIHAVLGTRKNFDEVADQYLKRLVLTLEAARGRLHMEKNVFLDAFGGYGTFSLAALNLGHSGYYVELNPVAYFFFRTFIKGEPEDYKRYALELIRRLEKECSEYRPEDKPYLTMRARFIKCPKCGEHVPFVARNYNRKLYYNHLRRINGVYKVRLKRDEAGERKVRLSYMGSDRKAFTDEPRKCPICGYEDYPSNNQIKELIREALKDNKEVFGFPLKDLPRAYAHPIADGYKESSKSGRLKEPYVEGIERAIDEIIENREEIKELVPYEELPKSVDEAPHGISEIARYIKYRTQLMTPRQLLCYAKIVRRLKENDIPDEVYDRLVMLILKSLQQNVLTHVEQSKRGIKRISANQTIGFFILPVEASIPGDKEGSLRNVLTHYTPKIKAFSGITRIHSTSKPVELRTGFKASEEVRIPHDNEVILINDAAQKLQEYSSIRYSADIAFLDPPYVDSVPYRDLSMLYYVRMKKMYDVSGLKDPEYVREYDLTDSDVDSFLKKLTEAFKGVQKVLKPDGIGVLQFAPPKTLYRIKDGKKEKVSIKELRLRVIAAMLSAGLYPMIATSVYSETSKEKGVGSIQTIKTIFVLFGNREAAEAFLNELMGRYGGELKDVMYLGEEGDLERIIKIISEDLKIGRLREFLEMIMDEDASPIAPTLSEVIPLVASIVGLLLGFYVRTTDPEIYYKALSRIVEEAQDVIDKIYESALGINLELAKKDLTAVYVYALMRGTIEEPSLEQLFGKDTKNVLEKLKDTVLTQPDNRSITKHAYAPRPLYEILSKADNKTLAENFPALYELLMAYRSIKNPGDRDEIEAAARKLIVEDPDRRRIYENLLSALRLYIRTIKERDIEEKDEERAIVSTLISILKEALERFFNADREPLRKRSTLYF